MPVEGNELVSVSRYIPILIDTYPDPINQTNLAKLAEVTPAAVSQARDALQKICDLKSLAYERKLLLKHDDNVWNKLLLYYLVNEDLESFIKYLVSDYFSDGLIESNIFDNIAEKLGSSFKEIFSEDDIVFIITFIKEKVVYSYENSKDTTSVTIGEHEIDMSSTTSSNVPYNVIYVISSLFDSDYDFLTDDQKIQFTQLGNKMLQFFVTNSDKIYSLIQQIENWLEMTEDESTTIKESYTILTTQVMNKVMLMVMCHVVGKKQVPPDILID